MSDAEMKRENEVRDILRGVPKNPESKLTPEFHAQFLKKIEAEPLPGRPFPAAGLVMTMSLAGVFCLAILNWMWMDIPQVQVVQGNVSISKSLRKGDQITTGPSDWVIFELKDGYRVKLQPNSQLKFHQFKPHFLPGKAVFHLTRGQVLVTVGGAKHKSYPVEIRTDNASARAMGTQFAVTAPSMYIPQSLIAVLKGTVRVGRISETILLKDSIVPVTQGNEVYVTKGASPLKPTRIVETKKALLQEQFQFGRQNQLILLISMSSYRVNELLKPCQVYIQIDPSHEAHKELMSVAGQIRKALKTRDPWQHAKAVRNFEALLEAQDDLDPVSGLLFVGAYFSHLNLHEDAVRVFEKVADQYPHSSYRSLALMAAAKIYSENLGETPKAHQLAQQILDQYPDSLEAPEAKRVLF